MRKKKPFNDTMRSFAQALIVLLNVCVCLMLMYEAVSCGSSGQRIFELYEYPPYLNQVSVTLLLAVSAFLAFVFTVLIIKKKIWALNAIVMVYAFLMFMDGQIDYFFTGLIAVHAILYYPLQKLYRS